MAETCCRGLHRVEVLDRHGAVSEAILELKFRRVRVLPPIGKQSRYPALDLTVLHATERGKPRGRDRIDWKLITDLPVGSRVEAIEKLQWYAQRWKIETLHKILKSGCHAEQSKLRTAERLVASRKTLTRLHACSNAASKNPSPTPRLRASERISARLTAAMPR